MDTLKSKVGDMELRCTNLQNELVTLRKEVKDANSLKEVAEIHGSPSILQFHRSNTFNFGSFVVSQHH